MPLDPTVKALFEQLAAAGRPAICDGSPAQARELMEAGRAALGHGPDVHQARHVVIPTRSGPLRSRLLVPAPEPDGLVVYFHGGGWVLGTLEQFEPLGRLLAAQSGCAVLLVDYRLAPETRFPGQVEDAVDAVRWAASQVEVLAGQRLPVAVAGDSAGANLATVAAAALTREVPLALQALIYPVVDCDFDTPSYRDPGNGGLVGRPDMIWFFDHYAPGEMRWDPRVSPLRRWDLSGLPPAHVVIAEYDVLRDEGEAYAARLRAAGVPTRVQHCPGLPHGFVRLHNLVPAADAQVRRVADAIGAACRGERQTQVGQRTGAIA